LTKKILLFIFIAHFLLKKWWLIGVIINIDVILINTISAIKIIASFQQQQTLKKH